MKFRDYILERKVFFQKIKFTWIIIANQNKCYNLKLNDSIKNTKKSFI